MSAAATAVSLNPAAGCAPDAISSLYPDHFHYGLPQPLSIAIPALGKFQQKLAVMTPMRQVINIHRPRSELESRCYADVQIGEAC